MPWPWDLHIFSECNHLGNCTLYAVLSFGSLGKNNNVEKKYHYETARETGKTHCKHYEKRHRN